VGVVRDLNHPTLAADLVPDFDLRPLLAGNQPEFKRQLLACSKTGKRATGK
jgi:hypothetical protein